MDTELMQEFKEWIRQQDSSHTTIEEIGNVIFFKTAYAKAEIHFYDMNIVEFNILSLKNEESEFYLHFQLNDMVHAKELFTEMMNTLIHITENQVIKVLLCCSSALTTSYFCEQLNKASEILTLKYQFEAVSYNKVYQKGLFYDIILLAPQIGFEEKKIHNAMKEIPIFTIPASIYGKYDTGKLIRLVEKTLKEHKPQPTKREVVSAKIDNTAKILCVGIFNSSRTIRLIYRYYRNGKIITNGEVKKPKIQISDVMDIIETMIALYPEIECIGLTMPGIAKLGTIHLPDAGIVYENVSKEIFEKYHRICVVSNDCNQVAYGISAIEEKYQNIIYNFQPYGKSIGGAGIIINGALIRGKEHGAGELLSLQNNLKLSDDIEKLAKTADGTYEIVAKTIACEIALLAPEAIYIHSAMAPDIEHLKELVRTLVSPQVMPDLYYINDTRDYMMIGTVLKSIEQLERYRQGLFMDDYYPERKKKK